MTKRTKSTLNREGTLVQRKTFRGTVVFRTSTPLTKRIGTNDKFVLKEEGIFRINKTSRSRREVCRKGTTSLREC